MADETKAQRFKRLATKRTQNVLYALRVLSNCANRSAYDYSDEEVRRIFAAIDRHVADAKSKFRETSGFEFKL